jgi:sRNA-binding protein
LLAALGDTVTPDELRQALRVYTQNGIYHRRLYVGATRYGLDGEPAGTVTAEHATPWVNPKPPDATPQARSKPPPKALVVEYKRKGPKHDRMRAWSAAATTVTGSKKGGGR